MKIIIFINIRDAKTRRYRNLKAYISENTKRLNNFLAWMMYINLFFHSIGNEKGSLKQ